MPTPLRIATFNLENLDDTPGAKPTLGDRIAVLQPQLLRLRADVLCLQEVHGQDAGRSRRLLALERLLAKTPYQDYHLASTQESPDRVYRERNLVIASRFPIVSSSQHLHDVVPAPAYRKITASPPETAAKEVQWERPILRATLRVPGGDLHVLNVHLKSKNPTDVKGQTIPRGSVPIWRTAAGYAEGSFLSAMKRLGQAVEARALVDRIFDGDPQARVVACGDFNAEVDDTPLVALRGDVEDHGNPELRSRVLLACESSIPASSRYTLFHHGRPNMLDHVLASRSMLAHYRGAEIHNELLHDESIAFATDEKYPESDHAPVVASFELP